MDRNTFQSPLVAIASWLGFAAAFCAAPSAFAFNVYTVGGDASCGFAFIQDAIDAAAGNPGEDYVFIAMNREYGDQHLVVTDQDVDIIGGFRQLQRLRARAERRRRSAVRRATACSRSRAPATFISAISSSPAR